MPELFETQTKMKVRIAPADNSVRPGNTEADPVDSLDIMALAAWPLPQAQGSDLTEIPARDEEDPHATITVDTREIDEYSGYDPRRAAAAARARRERDIDEDNVLDDDPDDDNDRSRTRDKKRKQRRPAEETTDNIDEDESYEEEHASRFGGMRRFISRIGRGFIGTTGPEDIDE
jgi:hypothetical protein